MVIGKEERKQVLARVGVKILREIFNDCSDISNLCTISGLYTEAETIARAMQFIDKAARQLTERREAE